MIIAAGMPNYLWAEAVAYHCLLRNQLYHSALTDKKMTPHEKATQKKPDMSNLHGFGCTVWVKQLGCGKLQPHADPGRFVGIDNESKGIWIYWPGKCHISIERNVYFNKDEDLSTEIVKIEGEYKTIINLNRFHATDNTCNSPKETKNKEDKPAASQMPPTDTQNTSEDPLSPLSPLSTPPSSPNLAPHQ